MNYKINITKLCKTNTVVAVKAYGLKGKELPLYEDAGLEREKERYNSLTFKA